MSTKYELKYNNRAVLPIFIFTTKMSLERGIWAPPDNILDQLTLLVMSTEGLGGSRSKRTTTELALSICKIWPRMTGSSGFNDIVETLLLTTPSPDRQPGARDDGLR